MNCMRCNDTKLIEGRVCPHCCEHPNLVELDTIKDSKYCTVCHHSVFNNGGGLVPDLSDKPSDELTFEEPEFDVHTARAYTVERYCMNPTCAKPFRGHPYKRYCSLRCREHEKRARARQKDLHTRRL